MLKNINVKLKTRRENTFNGVDYTPQKTGEKHKRESIPVNERAKVCMI